MKRFINFIMFLWQLPQNIIGLIIIAINFKSVKKRVGYYEVKHLYNCGISLGNFIILDSDVSHILKTVQHECGHRLQSKYLGPLYLIVIGLPSICGNIYDRLFHKYWKYKDRIYWYYNQPWEKWADTLGEVKRFE